MSLLSENLVRLSVIEYFQISRYKKINVIKIDQHRPYLRRENKTNKMASVLLPRQSSKKDVKNVKSRVNL